MEEVCNVNSGKKAKNGIIVSLITTAIFLFVSAIAMMVYVHYSFSTLFRDAGNIYLYVIVMILAFLYIYYNMYPITNVIIGKFFLFLLLVLVDVYEDFELNLGDQQLKDYLKR